jgi:RimJ/RimL family protein N-acetyltransferase
MHIRRLTPADALAFQALRLAGLKEEPSAFGSSYEEEKDFSASIIESRLAVQPDRGPFGAFEGEALIGLVALGRESMHKLAHKALIWGMYVKPEARRKGVARALLTEALGLARSVPALRQVNLCVNARNGGAIRLYESVGFKAYGHEPGAMLINGELHDEVHMCLRLTDRP